jgi:hypothetical protein
MDGRQRHSELMSGSNVRVGIDAETGKWASVNVRWGIRQRANPAPALPIACLPSTSLPSTRPAALPTVLENATALHFASHAMCMLLLNTPRECTHNRPIPRGTYVWLLRNCAKARAPSTPILFPGMSRVVIVLCTNCTKLDAPLPSSSQFGRAMVSPGTYMHHACSRVKNIGSCTCCTRRPPC